MEWGSMQNTYQGEIPADDSGLALASDLRRTSPANLYDKTNQLRPQAQEWPQQRPIRRMYPRRPLEMGDIMGLTTWSTVTPGDYLVGHNKNQSTRPRGRSSYDVSSTTPTPPGSKAASSMAMTVPPLGPGFGRPGGSLRGSRRGRYGSRNSLNGSGFSMGYYGDASTATTTSASATESTASSPRVMGSAIDNNSSYTSAHSFGALDIDFDRERTFQDFAGIIPLDLKGVPHMSTAWNGGQMQSSDTARSMDLLPGTDQYTTGLDRSSSDLPVHEMRDMKLDWPPVGLRDPVSSKEDIGTDPVKTTPTVIHGTPLKAKHNEALMKLSSSTPRAPYNETSGSHPGLLSALHGPYVSMGVDDMNMNVNNFSQRSPSSFDDANNDYLSESAGILIWGVGSRIPPPILEDTPGSSDFVEQAPHVAGVVGAGQPGDLVRTKSVDGVGVFRERRRRLRSLPNNALRDAKTIGAASPAPSNMAIPAVNDSVSVTNKMDSDWMDIAEDPGTRDAAAQLLASIEGKHVTSGNGNLSASETTTVETKSKRSEDAEDVVVDITGTVDKATSRAVSQQLLGLCDSTVNVIDKDRKAKEWDVISNSSAGDLMGNIISKKPRKSSLDHSSTHHDLAMTSARRSRRHSSNSRSIHDVRPQIGDHEAKRKSRSRVKQRQRSSQQIKKRAQRSNSVDYDGGQRPVLRFKDEEVLQIRAASDGEDAEIDIL
eukprot:Clim_evm16s206 gene=Clim_evmTU16s206